MKLFLIGLAVLATAYGEYSSEYQVPQDSLSVLEEIEGVPKSSAQSVDNGYRYKTVRRFRARHRRDVSELSPEYLPPVDEYAYQAPAAEYLAPIAPAAPVAEVASGVLADDGYRYKTVRKLRHRHRREAQYLPPAPSNEYLAPAAPSNEYLAPAAPSNEYLAPAAPSNEYLAPSAPVASGVLADDGYRYKAVRRRLRLRHRRDVSELAQYLPPVEQINIPQTPVVSVAPVADIPVLNNEYLAPLQQTETILADDGYRYKTIRRFKIRRH